VGWGVRASSRWSMATQPPFFLKNSHERPSTIIPKANTYEFLTKKWSPLETQECDLWQGNIWGRSVLSFGRWSMTTKPPFLSKIALKANTYEFFTKKWSPPEIQECDLWQCTSLWFDDQWPHNPIYWKNSHERPFSIISKANTYGFWTKKWSPPEI
jgi:hypothetical protein